MRLNTAQTEAVPFASLVPYPLVLDALKLILARREERRIGGRRGLRPLSLARRKYVRASVRAVVPEN